MVKGLSTNSSDSITIQPTEFVLFFLPFEPFLHMSNNKKKKERIKHEGIIEI